MKKIDRVGEEEEEEKDRKYKWRGATQIKTKPVVDMMDERKTTKHESPMMESFLITSFCAHY